MNITIVLSDITLKGGMERTSCLLANNLYIRGYSVRILSLCKTYDKPCFHILPSIPIFYLSENTYSSSQNLCIRFLFLLKIYRGLSRFWRKNNRNDAIISQGFLCSLLLFSLRKVNHKQIIACEHFRYELYNPLIRRFRNFIYSKLGEVVVLTNTDLNKYHRYLSNVTVIPNMLTFNGEVKADLSKKKIITVGRLDYQKGYDLLLNSVKGLFKDFPEWSLDIYGDGEWRELLERQIVAYGLSNNVYLKGFVENIAECYTKASIYVMTSRFEGFPMVLLEALSSGLAVISFDFPTGAKELLGTENGILVGAEDITALREGLIKLMSSEELRKQYATCGVKSIHSYTPDSICEKWRVLLKKINDVN